MNVESRNSRVVITRPRTRTSETEEIFRRHGLEPLILPVVEIRLPEATPELAEKLCRAPACDFIVFTSPTAVEKFVQLASGYDLDLKETRSVPVIALGPKTAAVAAGKGFEVFYTSEKGTSKALIEELGRGELKNELEGKSVFVPMSDIASPTVPDGLEGMGVKVESVTAYLNVAPGELSGDVMEDLVQNGAAAVAFFSPSAVRNFELLVLPRLPAGFPAETLAGTIGPVTARAARDVGFEDVLESPGRTAEDMAYSLAERLGGGR